MLKSRMERGLLAAIPVAAVLLAAPVAAHAADISSELPRMSPYPEQLYTKNSTGFSLSLERADFAGSGFTQAPEKTIPPNSQSFWSFSHDSTHSVKVEYSIGDTGDSAIMETPGPSPEGGSYGCKVVDTYGNPATRFSCTVESPPRPFTPMTFTVGETK
ncbi:hypothetical protein [Streptomyces sp. NRRL F-2664]|uniref:hypothetical protein n=1 Tax=Streptomyces sp. NRRL F-2664 TaxID=1463842 RepID=UPI00131BA6F5|nr:hypothetical protein [Streptomyces sp. NRRL F-2664]